uniref:Arrestin C-terminal-like domain-containing protein n=1 Tax=Panagrolaimus superbus TaxID=310955 RepID=A0A914YNY8_9BILA
MSNLQLILDEPSATFYPLSPISGQLIFESVDSIKVKDISVKLFGKAEVKFSDEINGKHEIFENEQIIIEKDFVLWSHDEKLAAGKHDFSFKFILPEECSPSFMGENGNIWYKLIAKVNASGNDELEVEEIITVSPMTYISTNSPIICTTTFSNVSITANVPYRIFNLDDEIPLSIEITNFSNFAVESIEAGLCWSSTFFGKPLSTDSPAKCETIKGELDYANIPFSVPTGATTTFNHTLKSTATLPTISSCPILSHNYLICVRIHFFGASEHVQEFFIPVILSKIAFHKIVESGETMLPSESAEIGTFPKVTVPQSHVEKNKDTSEISTDHGTNELNCSNTDGETPAPDSLHV